MFFRLAKVSLCIIDFFYPSLKESLGGIFHFFFLFWSQTTDMGGIVGLLATKLTK